MIRLISGENEFMVIAEQARVIADYLASFDAFGLEKIDATETDINRLRDALAQLPFLVPKKLVVIRSPFSQKTVLETIEATLSSIPDEVDVLLVDTKADKRTRLYKLLQKDGAVTEYTALKGATLKTWVSVYTKDLGSTIASGEIDLLIDRVGSDQMALARELEKLAVDSPITKELILSRTDQQLQSSVFELLDAVFAKNQTRSLGILEELYAKKTDPAEILSLVAWQLNVFAHVLYAGTKSSQDIARAAKLHPFVVGKAMTAASRLTKQTLAMAISLTLEADLKTKTSSADAKDVLRLLLLKLISL